MSLRYQKCELPDLDLLLQISRSTFIEAFEDQNNPEDFWSYVNTAFSSKMLAEQMNNTDTEFYFTYVDGQLGGYFKLNENEAQTDIKTNDALEIERIYVKKEFQGQGIGAAMLKKIRAIALHRTKSYMWLGVWEHNLKAIDFYEKNGFVKFGRHPYYIGKDKQMDWLMRFDLINFGPTKSN